MVCKYHTSRSFHSKIATSVHRTVMLRQKPSVHISKTGCKGTFFPYSKKYEHGISCPINMADIHRLTYSMSVDIVECIEDTPEYYISIGSFNYNEQLVSTDIVYSPSCFSFSVFGPPSAIPSIYS